MTFARVFLAATISVVVAGLIPVHIAAVLSCWAILAASGWWYTTASARGGAVPDLFGYGAGMGALVGAPVSLTATILSLFVHHARMDVWMVGLLGSSCLLGAFLGAIGGAIGTLRVARTKSTAAQVRSARFAWIAIAILVLLVGAGVAYVFLLAYAMSDAMGNMH